MTQFYLRLPKEKEALRLPGKDLPHSKRDPKKRQSFLLLDATVADWDMGYNFQLSPEEKSKTLRNVKKQINK